MATTFRNPPLIEMIAELRWNIPPTTQGIPLPVLPDRVGSCEEMFVRWMVRMGALGYEHVERLIPHGFPLLPHEPVLRLRPKMGEPDTTLYQIGPHLFTANATPPYKSWSHFAPKVFSGVQALLTSRPESDAPSPLLVSLRYINAFRENLTQGQSLPGFLARKLGMQININPAISRHCLSDQEISVWIQLVVPVKMGTLRIQFAEGRIQDESALIMDMTVALADLVAPDTDAIMAAFAQAHEIAHQVFIELTAPIAPLMQPEE